jgi:hypothetical protein
MGAFRFKDSDVYYQWASDISFNGIRLEVLTSKRDILFDVGAPESGHITVNTFGKDVDADLIVAAVELTRTAR